MFASFDQLVKNFALLIALHLLPCRIVPFLIGIPCLFPFVRLQVDPLPEKDLNNLADTLKGRTYPQRVLPCGWAILFSRQNHFFRGSYYLQR